MGLHFAVYEAFGDHIEAGPAGYLVRSSSDCPKGTVQVQLPFRSRGATVAAVLRAIASGRPAVIGSASLSAELRSLYRALVSAGCPVEVTPGQVSVQPGGFASGIRWQVPGDKIEAGTLACAIAATGGSGRIRGVRSDDMTPLVKTLNVLGIQAVTAAADGGAARQVCLMVMKPGHAIKDPRRGMTVRSSGLR